MPVYIYVASLVVSFSSENFKIVEFCDIFFSIVNTKAEVRLDIMRADWLPTEVREKLMEQVCDVFIKLFHIKKYIILNSNSLSLWIVFLYCSKCTNFPMVLL